MSDAIDRFMNLEIPEEQYLSRNIQTVWARSIASGASRQDTAYAILSIAVGNISDLEERVIALEKQAGITPPKPQAP